MQLLILVLVFMVIGYALARLGADAEANSDKIVTGPVDPSRRRLGWRPTLFRRENLPKQFRIWVAESATALFPEDFAQWVKALPQAEAEAFVQALDSYLEGLGFNLKQGIEGSLDRQPRMKSVFVEAIVVYSQAYRRAKKANQDAEKKEAGEQAEPGAASNGKKPAEKSVSRRNSELELIPEAVAA